MIRAKAADADEAFFAKDPAADERTVRKGFWPKVTRVASRLPFAEDLLAAYYCAFDRQTAFPTSCRCSASPTMPRCSPRR